MVPLANWALFQHHWAFVMHDLPVLNPGAQAQQGSQYITASSSIGALANNEERVTRREEQQHQVANNIKIPSLHFGTCIQALLGWP
jgi:hypothetical protein